MNVLEMLFMIGCIWFGIGIADGDAKLIGMSLGVFGILVLVSLAKVAKKGKKKNGENDITIVLPRIRD